MMDDDDFHEGGDDDDDDDDDEEEDQGDDDYHDDDDDDDDNDYHDDDDDVEDEDEDAAEDVDDDGGDDGGDDGVDFNDDAGLIDMILLFKKYSRYLNINISTIFDSDTSDLMTCGLKGLMTLFCLPAFLTPGNGPWCVCVCVCVSGGFVGVASCHREGAIEWKHDQIWQCCTV